MNGCWRRFFSGNQSYPHQTVVTSSWLIRFGWVTARWKALCRKRSKMESFIVQLLWNSEIGVPKVDWISPNYTFTRPNTIQYEECIVKLYLSILYVKYVKFLDCLPTLNNCIFQLRRSWTMKDSIFECFRQNAFQRAVTCPKRISHDEVTTVWWW